MRTATISHSTPQSRTSCAKTASERTSPGVVASEIRAMSVKEGKVTSPGAKTRGNGGGSDVEPGLVPRGHARVARGPGLRRRVGDDRRRRRVHGRNAGGDRAVRRAHAAPATADG